MFDTAQRPILQKVNFNSPFGLWCHHNAMWQQVLAAPHVNGGVVSSGASSHAFDDFVGKVLGADEGDSISTDDLRSFLLTADLFQKGGGVDPTTGLERDWWSARQSPAETFERLFSVFGDVTFDCHGQAVLFGQLFEFSAQRQFVPGAGRGACVAFEPVIRTSYSWLRTSGGSVPIAGASEGSWLIATLGRDTVSTMCNACGIVHEFACRADLSRSVCTSRSTSAVRSMIRM
jgi:hypothetical protein